MTLDPRIFAVRDDLADITLRARFSAPRYVEGRPARVIVGRAPVHRSPKSGSPLDTHYHYGERVLVFDETRASAWCQSCADSYVGYVSARHLALGETPNPTHFVANRGAYIYRVPDLRADPLDFLPRYSPVVVVESGTATRDTAYARLDTGGFLPESCLAISPPRSADLVAAASLYLGCPYLWAGRSFLGLDCSGLVQQAFRDLGVAVPRDTDMQRETIGARVEIAVLGDLWRDDLIYIPGHVMICAGNGDVIHASGGEMTVRRESLAPLLKAWGYGVADLTVRRP
ncbi:MAG TPA: NlpC/P60 family protein [Stellaceae bacterium]|jgi:cell wall-associated NlpC family hydrolase|nr:NlpC/P60 family protein [Stellaceae bacterium]